MLLLLLLLLTRDAHKSWTMTHCQHCTYTTIHIMHK